jgi:hypothetical protein
MPLPPAFVSKLFVSEERTNSFVIPKFEVEIPEAAPKECVVLADP